MRLSAAAWISHGRVQRRLGLGPRSRLDLLRNLVTGLVRHERIEAPRARVDEMRFYAEHVSVGGGGALGLSPPGRRALPWARGGPCPEWCPARAPPNRPFPPSPAWQLIDYAKRGDGDPAAMRMADFWLTEKDLIHKLFKVLVPRFQAHTGHYTRMHQIPNRENLDRAKMAVIEYKGNALPPLPLRPHDSEKTLVNQLLKGYREDLLSTREAQQNLPE
uniref:Large ribosomal subunit protein bL17m n=1 Tax=Varanus komodoensis TaxID=61221 RepID=A0A8D2JAV9_VARKO